MSTIVSMTKRELPASTSRRPALPASTTVARLVTQYAVDIEQLLDFDSFEYRNEQLLLELRVGDPSTHQCSYTLRHEELLLGELLLTRRTPFKESELLQLERCLGAMTPLLIGALRVS